MITTRNINVNLDKGKLKLRHITTKDIDVGVRVEPPKAPIKTKSITTTTLADVADIAEKKKRDDIMAERKLEMKDEKKIVIEKKKPIKEVVLDLEKVEIITAPAIVKDKDGKSMPTIIVNEKGEANKGFEKGDAVYQEEQKKPWKEMTDDEKKVAIKERTAKMMATKARKKKEGLK